MVVAKVAVEMSAVYFDKPYSYKIPDELLHKAKPGCRVTVPFGGGNRKKSGLILEVGSDSELEVLKPILSVVDDSPVLSDEMLKMVYYLKETTFCSLYDAVKCVLPAGLNVKIVTSYKASDYITLDSIPDDICEDSKTVLTFLIKSQASIKLEKIYEIMGFGSESKVLDELLKRGLIIRTDDAVRKVGDAAVKTAFLAVSDEEISNYKLTDKQKSVVKILSDIGEASVKELCYFTGVTSGVIKTLEKNGIISIYDREYYRLPEEISESTAKSEIVLTDEQQLAYENISERIDAHTACATLLYGVTGSGKTSVFLKTIDKVIEEGRGVIVMVPEIALTPQTVGIFQKRYGNSVAVFHSALSIGQRLDEWKRVKNGDAQIAIGTRSAVFAPFDDLGLIVMDEEQEHTYKSEKNPKYHAKNVARFRCAYHNCSLLLASATPSIESFYYAKTGRYHLEMLTKRYGEAALPNVEIVDMNTQEAVSENISRELYDAVLKNINQGYQSIILLNRRGFHTFASCRNCGHVMMCPNCSISLTYHRANNRLLCHYCGHSEEFLKECPECSSDKVRYSGFGTQKIEYELKKYFPDARILRMDADTTMKRSSYEKKLAAFANGEYDIMLGTQMVAKGLDFPKVTLAAVVSADQLLFADDFRSFEKSFSLLTQVIGRSGRGTQKGRAIIQTFTSDSDVIELASEQNYEKFYANEILIRKMMLYPPFSDICLVSFVGEEEQRVKNSAYGYLDLLKINLQEEYSDQPVRILGPSCMQVARISNKYRYKIIIKCRNTKKFRELISKLINYCGKDKEYKGVSISADMNPENTN